MYPSHLSSQQPTFSPAPYDRHEFTPVPPPFLHNINLHSLDNSRPLYHVLFINHNTYCGRSFLLPFIPSSLDHPCRHYQFLPHLLPLTLPTAALYHPSRLHPSPILRKAFDTPQTVPHVLEYQEGFILITLNTFQPTRTFRYHWHILLIDLIFIHTTLPYRAYVRYPWPHLRLLVPQVLYTTL